jgi:hypothetical protein
VTKENAGNKEKSGGCADAALVGVQTCALGTAPPPNKGGDKELMKENAGKKEKSGGCADAALVGVRTLLRGRRRRWTRVMARR